MQIQYPLDENIILTNEFSGEDYRNIQDFLTTSYWAKGRNLKKTVQSFENSHSFIVKTTQGELVGTMRLITDTCVFAYIADVFVMEKYRGKKIAEWMVRTVMEMPEYEGVERWMLATMDASHFYEKFGFGPMSIPDWMMDYRPAPP